MQNIKDSYLYWSDEDKENLKKAKSFSDLTKIALSIILAMVVEEGKRAEKEKRKSRELCLVSGPISSGGSGAIEENLFLFDRAIECITNRGFLIFNQMPFEKPIQILKEKYDSPHNLLLLEEFYLPILQSGFIRQIHFMPNWFTSYGSRWEYTQAVRLCIKRNILDSLQ